MGIPKISRLSVIDTKRSRAVRDWRGFPDRELRDSLPKVS